MELESFSLLNTDEIPEDADALVVDTDREHYAFRQPYILLPDVTCYARAGDSQIVYQIAQSEFDALTAAARAVILNADHAPEKA